MKIYVLASGSEGNASVFESNGTRVLVDAGIGPRAFVQRLVDLGSDAPDAIVVTHAHQDHVGQAARIAKKLRIPVYATQATARAAWLGDPARVRVFDSREPFVIGALTVSPVPVPHDAAQVALIVSDGVRRAVIATDLGEMTEALASELALADVVLLESNYDRGMLRNGPYPEALKRRVDSAKGHLSNEQTNSALRRLSARTRAVVLMHLSRTNNRTDLALDSARDALAGRAVDLFVASQTGALVIDANAAAQVRHPSRRTRRFRHMNPNQLSLFP